MIKKILSSDDDIATAIARITLGLVMFPHGAQKVLGWFGGHGFEGTMGFFTQQMGIPAVLAFLAIVAEFAGSIALIIGGLSRIAAFGIGFTMLVAAFMGHTANGFFMNWAGSQKGEGFEYHLLAIGLAVVVMIRGAGALSVDRALVKRIESSSSAQSPAISSQSVRSLRA